MTSFPNTIASFLFDSKEKENSELVEDIISFYWSYVRKAISNKEYYNINLKGLGSFVINEKKLNQALAKKYQHIASLDKKQYTSFGPCTPTTNVFSISAVLLGPVA